MNSINNDKDLNVEYMQTLDKVRFIHFWLRKTEYPHYVYLPDKITYFDSIAAVWNKLNMNSQSRYSGGQLACCIYCSTFVFLHIDIYFLLTQLLTCFINTCVCKMFPRCQVVKYITPGFVFSCVITNSLSSIRITVREL